MAQDYGQSSPEQTAALMKKFKDYQKARAEHTRRLVRQAAGGTAETLRTGRSAEETFRVRAPDYGDEYMTPKEKMAKRQELIASIAEQEAFTKLQLLENARTELRETMANQRAAGNMFVQLEGQRSQQAQNAARLKRAEYENELKDLDRRLGDLNTMGEAGTAVFKAAFSELDRGSPGYRAAYREMLAGALAQGGMSLEEFGGLDSEERRDTEQNVHKAMKHWQTVQLAMRVPEILELSKDEVGEGLAVIIALGGELDISQKALAAADPRAARMLDDEVTAQAQEMQQLNLETMNSWDIYKRAHNQSYTNQGPVKDVAEEIANSQASISEALNAAVDISGPSAARVLAGEEAAPVVFEEPGAFEGDGTAKRPTDEEEAAFEAERRAVQPGLDAPPPQADYHSSLFGFPIKPAGTAYDRTLQALDLLEEFPEHPPLEHFRNELLASTEFKTFATDRGYEDDAFALKQLRREMRHGKRKRLTKSREALRRNQEEGVAPPGLLGKPAKQKTPAKEAGKARGGLDTETRRRRSAGAVGGAAKPKTEYSAD